MKLKKILTFSLVAMNVWLLSFFCTSNLKTTNDESIIVNNEKVPLRQKATKKLNLSSSDQASIETTNVDYDLRYLYGGEENYLNFNIWDLVPKSDETRDTSFKFLCAKPVGKNLYLYVYHNDNSNRDIVSANFTISDSKVQNESTGNFGENFTNKYGRFINSYGYKQRFMKFAVDDIIDLTSDNRFLISKCNITFKDNSTTSDYIINDEFAFNNSTDDFMYEYFKDNYIKITDGEVSMLLTNKSSVVHGGFGERPYYEAYEDFYYFFNTDKQMDDLIEVQYDYELQSYEVEYYTPGADTDTQGRSYYKAQHIYTGVYNDYDSSKNRDREIYGFTDNFSQVFFNQRVDKSTIAVNVTRPYFLWWNKDVQVNFDNILNCTKVDELSVDDNLKTLIKDVNRKRSILNEQPYSWAFHVTQSLREMTDTKLVGALWDMFGGTLHAFCDCHEVKQTLITWLKFRTNNIEFEFNALDFPKDTTSVYINSVPFKTLGDEIIDNLVSFWDWLLRSFCNTGNDLIGLLITILVILIIVSCLPLILSLFKLVFGSIHSGIKSISKSIDNHRMKKKRKK